MAAAARLSLDEWQQLILIDALGEREDTKWAAFEVALVVSRQNGKGTVQEARELAGLFSFGEKLLIHSAHEQATSSEHLRRLLDLIEGVPEFDRRVLKVLKGKGAEAIELRGGQRILFKTRTSSGGRGLTGDYVCLDEAMHLPASTMGSLVPTMAAKSVTGNPQLWYASSAVDQRVHDHGVTLSRVRSRALQGARRLAYFEWSADAESPESASDEMLGDERAWAQANPGLGIRISSEHVANEYGGALGRREFAVERLSIGDWPDPSPTRTSVIPIEVWNARTDEDSAALDPVFFAFDVTPDRAWSSIAVGGKRGDGLSHVEVIDRRPGTAWLAPRMAEICGRHEYIGVGCDTYGPAGSIVAELEQRGIKVHAVTGQEHAQACGMFYDGIVEGDGTVRHLGTPELDDAIRGAAQRKLGDAWAWSRKNSTIDISPLVAVTLALWGSLTRAATSEPLVYWGG